MFDIGREVVVLALLQFAVGVFFAISGFHKLFVPARHRAMRETLVSLRIPLIKFSEWWVPGWEFIGGLGLMVSSGIVSDFFAFVLLVISIVACCTDGPRRVDSMYPLNWADRLDDWLYLPETWLVVALAAILII